MSDSARLIGVYRAYLSKLEHQAMSEQERCKRIGYVLQEIKRIKQRGAPWVMTGRATLLIADNTYDHLVRHRWFLERYSYQIVSAFDADSARVIIDLGKIDVALLDIRLTDDEDRSDYSGLEVAEASNATIPKVLITRYPSPEVIRRALRQRLRGLPPPAVDVLSKREPVKLLLKAIERALMIGRL